MALWFRSYSLLIFIIFQIDIINSKSQLIQLDENDWDRMLAGEWMVEFFAPWCPACKALQPTWEEFSSWSKDLDLSVAQVDVTLSPGLSGRFMVTALPTILHVHNGEFRPYKGSRDKESFMSFIEDKKWKQIEAIPSWKSPSSIQMSIVSSFFKLSQVLRNVHNKLMEEYGLPSWGSYLIFSIVIFIVGGLVGMVIVCCIDFFYSVKFQLQKTEVKHQKEVTKKDESEEETAPEDDLVDDETTTESAAVRKRKVPKAN